MYIRSIKPGVAVGAFNPYNLVTKSKYNALKLALPVPSLR